jgi:redox-sensitive bicupin YhaK (pirin superfamily)
MYNESLVRSFFVLLGGECTYKGGSAQFMRSGSGAMHEEMWETRPDRATKIELFQLWVNLPARLKMNPPAIRYVGADWGAPYAEETQVDEATGVQTRVRTIGDSATLERAIEGQGSVLEPRPSFKIQYATLPPGGSWIAPAQPAHTALCYVARGGSVQVNGEESGDVPTGSTCIFAGDGDSIWLVNQGKDDSEVPLLH